jgi:hypothetical protein
MSFDLQQMVQDMMHLNVQAQQCSSQTPEGKTLQEVIAELEGLPLVHSQMPVPPTAPPPNNYAQADEIIEGPVLQDILERLRRVERAVAELLLRANNGIRE